MPFNNPFDHHLPGPYGSVRGSTLGPGTGLQLAERVSRVARGCEITNKVVSLVRVP